jgi:hypothetical protein
MCCSFKSGKAESIIQIGEEEEEAVLDKRTPKGPGHPYNHHHPLKSSSSINQIKPGIHGSGSQTTTTSQECAICLEEGPIETMVYLPCLHYFHDPCVRNWVKQMPKCPSCRSPVFLVGEVETHVSVALQVQQPNQNFNQNSAHQLNQSDQPATYCGLTCCGWGLVFFCLCMGVFGTMGGWLPALL